MIRQEKNQFKVYWSSNKYEIVDKQGGIRLLKDDIHEARPE